MQPLRGYHYYKKYWEPKESEKWICRHDETDNPFDVFAIRTYDAEGKTVGHLPRELSRVTKVFLMDRGADITAVLTKTRYGRSPLVQGGLKSLIWLR